jgi:hypothetical protein
MLQVTPQHQLFLAVEPVDFRAGIDGLRALCERQAINLRRQRLLALP